jgi:outer membrane protein OmpA-like peptidoglycan-associated protein
MHPERYFSLFTVCSILLFSCNVPRRIAKEKHEYMQQTYTDVKKAVNEAEVTILNDSLRVLFPENLLFKEGGSSIQESTYPIMKRFAEALLIYKNTEILVNGYTDATGADSSNMKLSQARAEAAGALLKLYGVDVARMFFWGLGSKHPIGDNKTKEGRRKNRRVEFIVLYKYPI